MNSCERVMTAMRGGQPDRVPLIETVIDPGVWKPLCPEATDAADFCDRMDMDAVCCGGLFTKVRELEDGSYYDEWGVRYVPGSEVIDHPVEGCIESMDDLRKYVPPDPEADHRLGVLPDLVSRYKGKRSIWFGQRAAFMWSAFLMGFENMLMALVAEPKLAGAVMDMVLETNMSIVRRAIRAGAEVVVVPDDWAHNSGPLMSPKVFSELILPRFQKMVDLIHDEGGLVLKHTDGNIYPILDMLVATGIDALNPIEPKAGMDLVTVRERVGSKLCLVGNIDVSELLPHGTPEEVEQTVRQAMLDGGRDGSFIVASSNSIHSSCRSENFLAHIRATQRWGKYPLSY